MRLQNIAVSVTTSGVAATLALLLCGCGKAPSPTEDAGSLSPLPGTTATSSPWEGATAPSPIAAGTSVKEQAETTISPAASPAENQLVSALARYAQADEKTRLDIEEHLGELAEQGVDKKSIAATLTSMFAMEKSAVVKLSILDELDALGPPYVFDQAIAATASNEDLEVRDEAISILKDLGDKRAISTLQALLTDPDEDIREEAQEAINSLNSSSSP